MIFLAIIILWVFGVFITLTLCNYIDRMNGLSPELAYEEEDWKENVLICSCIWPLILLFALFLLLGNFFKKMSIAITEVMVALSNKDKD